MEKPVARLQATLKITVRELMTDNQTIGCKASLSIYKWKALITVALGTALGTMDMSVTNLSLPILTRIFNVPLTTVIWVALAYGLITTSLALVLGRAGDLIGRKKIYTGGILIFSLGLILCALAQSIGQLIAFRFFQAVGSSMMVATSAAIVTEVFPPNERGMGLGLLGVSVSAGFITGPILGGFLLSWFGWRSIFYARAPIALLIFIMAWIILRPEQPKKEKVKFDLLGTFLSASSLSGFVFAFSQINRLGPVSPLFLLLIGLSLAGFFLFIWEERRTEAPIVDLTLFKNPVFSRATLALLLTFISYPCTAMLIPFYLMQGLNLEPDQAGGIMAVGSLATIIVGPISGWLSDRFGQAVFAILGAATTLAGFILMRGFGIQTSLISIMLVMFVFGSGIGLFQSPNNSSLMGSVERNRLGTASALMATLRQVGFSLGTAVTGALYSIRRPLHQDSLSRLNPNNESISNQAVTLAFHDILLVAIFLMSVVLLLSIVSETKKKTRHTVGSL
jgi:EmrB/QacA subfamily drug resistance transporter